MTRRTRTRCRPPVHPPPLPAHVRSHLLRPTVDVDQVIADYEADTVVSAICATHRIGLTRLYRILDEHRIPRRRPNAPRLPNRLRERILADYAAGREVPDIARRHRVSTSTVSSIANRAGQRAAMPAKGWDAFEEGEVWPPSNQAVMESIVAATRARVSVDRGRLDDVADAYDRGGVGAVQDVLNVSRSQAYRLIKLARERGLLTAGDQR